MVAAAVLSTSPGISAPRSPATATPHRGAYGVALGALLGATALLYLWPSSASGWSNEYYSAAAQAGAQSWKAFFFGSLDAGNAITVDKPPLGLWPIALSVRLLGLSPFSVLLPQALAGVGTVALVVSSVRHLTASARLGLLAGGIFALTPVSVLVFRYNNPDAMLILLLVGAAVATLRALDSERAGAWMLGAGALVGLGFLTKMGEALMVLPALSLTYLVFSEAPLLRRVKHLVGAAAALVASAGWWVAIVTLWPAASRPWIGGSTTDSVLGLAFGYNGVGRISGADAAATTGGTWQLSRAGSVFGLPSATASLWLMPAALILALVALRLTRGDERARRQRAGLVMWLAWASTMVVVFAVMTGIFHSYYTIMIAPATSVLAVVGASVVLQDQARPLARTALVWAATSTGVLAFVLLTLTPGWLPFLRWTVLAATVVLAVSLARIGVTQQHAMRWVAAAALVAAASPTAYSVATAAAPHGGDSPVVGPGHAVVPGGLNADLVLDFAAPWLASKSSGQPDVVDGPASPQVAAAVRGGADGYRWAAATGGSRAASTLELSSGAPVIAIGGYKGTDPAPSLSGFESMVAAGEVHYFLAGWTSGPTLTEIQDWVVVRFQHDTIDGTAVYDLTSPLVT